MGKKQTKKSSRQPLHQINFNRWRYVVGGEELKEYDDVRKAMKEKSGLIIVERV